MSCRIPHIYQYEIPIPEGMRASDKKHRYIDFALRDPKTGEPVIGIETDESSHFVGDRPKDDFEREMEVLNASGIPIHRIPEAYWFGGFPPGGSLEYQKKIEVRQLRLLCIALQERDRVTKTHKNKRFVAPMSLPRRPGFLRRLWQMVTGI